MPRPGHRWRFITVNAHGSWLPGDKRGFRNRDHRIHSTGDYKNPPPPEDHAGLNEFNKKRTGLAVRIPKDLRSTIGRAMIARLQKEGFQVLAVSVSFDHAHLLTELPDDIGKIKQIIGRCKRAACEAVKKEMPGTIWSAGGDWEPVDNPKHQSNCYDYALTKQGSRAWTWSYKTGEKDAKVE